MNSEIYRYENLAQFLKREKSEEHCPGACKRYDCSKIPKNLEPLSKIALIISGSMY